VSSRVRRPKLSRKARQARDLEAGLALVVALARAPVVVLAVVVPAVVVVLAAEAAVVPAAAVALAAAEEVPAAAGRVVKDYLDEMHGNPEAAHHSASVVRGQEQVARESS
jgi:hypothetical protein